MIHQPSWLRHPTWFVVLFGAVGCAASTSSQPAPATAAQPAAEAAPAGDSRPITQVGLISNDVKRIEEIQELDHKNQLQAQRVKSLESTVSELEQKLAAALQRGVDPAAGKPSATAATEQTSEGGRVRVRLSGELVFEPNSARISRAGRRALKEVAKVLHDTPAKRIEVAGHTDSLPTNKKYEDNWQLSGERAHRVVAYLASEGVDPHHLVAVGYGDTSPLDVADTAEARGRNRRVEIFITPE